MSIRKRTWKSSDVEKTAWVVNYTDRKGVRRLKTFERKRDAEAFATTAKVEIRGGVHVAERESVRLAAAGEMWIKGGEDAGLERSTTAAYRSHLDLHMTPFIGQERLSDLSVPLLRSFEDDLRANGRSPAMVRRVMVSLGTLLADAQERGLVARNIVRDMRGRRRRGEQQDKRQKGRLKVGVDIPTREEISAIVAVGAGRWRPLLVTAIFTGLRASELRGLRWADVDFVKREVRVHQRADCYNVIGKPKSISGERTVPLPPAALNTLREWRLRCPKGELDLVFPNGQGRVESHSNIIKRGLLPTLVKAGIVGRYTGLHALRHFFASWCINRQQEGGLGLPAKAVQERLGHSTIVLTMDVYGHLFPRGDDEDELAAAESSLLGLRDINAT